VRKNHKQRKEKKEVLTINLLDGNASGVVLSDHLRVKQGSLEHRGGSSFAKWSLNTELGGGIKEEEARNRDFYKKESKKDGKGKKREGEREKRRKRKRKRQGQRQWKRAKQREREITNPLWC